MLLAMKSWVLWIIYDYYQNLTLRVSVSSSYMGEWCYLGGALCVMAWVVAMDNWLTKWHDISRDIVEALHWRHNGRYSVSNHKPHDCLLNRLFRCISKKTSKLRVTGLCAGNSPGTGEFPSQMTSDAKNVSIWWRHHDFRKMASDVCVYIGFLYVKWLHPTKYAQGLQFIVFFVVMAFKRFTLILLDYLTATRTSIPAKIMSTQIKT